MQLARGRVHLQDREVRRRVGADDGGAVLRAVAERDRDRAGVCDHVVVSDDVARGVVDEPGALGLRLLGAGASERERRVARAPGGRRDNLDDAIAGGPVDAVDRHRLRRRGRGARRGGLLHDSCRVVGAVRAERGVAAGSGSGAHSQGSGSDQIGRALVEHFGIPFQLLRIAVSPHQTSRA